MRLKILKWRIPERILKHIVNRRYKMDNGLVELVKLYDRFRTMSENEYLDLVDKANEQDKILKDISNSYMEIENEL